MPRFTTMSSRSRRACRLWPIRRSCHSRRRANEESLWGSLTVRRSGLPAPKVANGLETKRLALLRVELRPRGVAFGDDGGHRPAIVRFGDDDIAVACDEMIGMDEVGVQALWSRVDARKQGVLVDDIQHVPAHVRD